MLCTLNYGLYRTVLAAHILIVVVVCAFIVEGLHREPRSKCQSTYQLRYTYVSVYNHTCYQFVVNEKKDFGDAQDYCKDNGGQLAIVKSDAVNTFIGDMLEKTYGVRYSPVWIGLQYFGREQLYKWVDGSVLGQYTKFMESTAVYGENCVGIIPNSRLWRDFLCESTVLGVSLSDKKMFVCEYRLIPITPTTTQKPKPITMNDCPESIPRDKYLKVFGDKCYKFEFDVVKTFVEADKHCQEEGGRLAIVNNKNINDFIKGELYSISKKHAIPTWIGLRYSIGRGIFQWVDGTAMHFFNFRQLPLDARVLCVAISEEDGKWLLASCSRVSLYSVCLVLSKTHGSRSKCHFMHRINFTDSIYNHTCYQFVVNEKKDFGDAQDYCKDNGGQLAIVKSDAVNTFIGDMLEKTYGVRYSPVWIGLQYFGREQLYKWVDGSVLGQYTKFMESTAVYGENCVGIIPNSRLWRDFLCESTVLGVSLSDKKMFVCEYRLIPITPTTTKKPKPITMNDCPGSIPRDKYLKVFGDKCYRFEFVDVKTFVEADKHCQEDGGRLAIVNNKNINDFIQGELYFISKKHGIPTWIGLRYDLSRWMFYWVDETPFLYSNFRDVRFYRTTMCVALNEKDGKWLVKSCTHPTLPYVCQYLTGGHPSSKTIYPSAFITTTSNNITTYH